MQYLYQDTGLIRCTFGDQIHLDGKSLYESHKIGDSGRKIGLHKDSFEGQKIQECRKGLL